MLQQQQKAIKNMKIMKVTQVCLTILASFTSLLLLSTRARAAGEDYKITKISPAVIITPDYNYIGDQRRIPGPFAQWLEIEVQFESYVDFTDELTFRYYLLFAGNLLRGRLKSNLNLGPVLFMEIIDKAWDEPKRTIPERFHRERMEANRAAVARAEGVWTTGTLCAAQSD